MANLMNIHNMLASGQYAAPENPVQQQRRRQAEIEQAEANTALQEMQTRKGYEEIEQILENAPITSAKRFAMIGDFDRANQILKDAGISGTVDVETTPEGYKRLVAKSKNGEVIPLGPLDKKRAEAVLARAKASELKDRYVKVNLFNPLTDEQFPASYDKFTGKYIDADHNEITGPFLQIDDTAGDVRSKINVDLTKTTGNELLKRADAAEQELTMLTAVQRTLEGVETGTLTEFKTAVSKFADALGIPGIDMSKVASIESAGAILSTLVTESAQKLSGALSDKDIELLVGAYPTLSTTPEGRKKIIETMRRVAERHRQKASEFSRFVGSSPSGGMIGVSGKGWLDHWDKYKKENPLFTKDEFSGYSRSDSGSKVNIRNKYNIPGS